MRRFVRVWTRLVRHHSPRALAMAATPTSPFTPTEQSAIVVAAVTAALLAVWNILRALRPRAGPVRYAPFGLAILLLSFAFVGFVVIYAIPFLLRFPELVAAIMAVGPLAVAIAYA